MDSDMPMADDSSADSLPPQQRFNIADVLGGAAAAGGEEGAYSDMFEPEEAAVNERLAKLYPHVRRQPLPRHWSNTDKFHSLAMSSDNLRVRYKGKGVNHKDAASVRANQPIPKATVVYYFEITVTSKSGSGYLGIGLSEKTVNLNRLPGWDATSYGFHGDDGAFFSSSGKGVDYGPVYTTGDVVGCGINFVTRQLFFTKNGVNLGVAACNLPTSNALYPTIGMQTTGEAVDTNFGQRPFVYDIARDQLAAEAVTLANVNAIELPSEKAIWLNRTISNWLSHEGYSRALEAFNRATGTTQPSSSGSSASSSSTESLARKSSSGSGSTIAAAAAAATGGERQSVVKLLRKAIQEEMDNRRAIIRLVHEGRSADAAAKVQQFYPHLLNANKQLALLLRIQQFVEMLVAITRDISLSAESINGAGGWQAAGSPTAGPSQPAGRAKRGPQHADNGTRNAVKRRSSEAAHDEAQQPATRQSPRTRRAATTTTTTTSSSSSRSSHSAATNGAASGSDEPMELEEPALRHHPTNGNSQQQQQPTNGSAPPAVGTPPTSTTIIEEQPTADDEAETDAGAATARNGHQQLLEKGFEKYLPLIEFGQALALFASTQLYDTPSPQLRKRMNDAFSLICSPCPYISDNNYLLEPKQRYIVGKALNSAILETLGKESSSSLDRHIRKARHLREKAMAVAASAIFADADRLIFGGAGGGVEKTVTQV